MARQLTRFEGPIAVALDQHFRDRWMLDGGDDLPPDAVVPGAELPRGPPIHEARTYCNEPSEAPNEVRELYLRLEVVLVLPSARHDDNSFGQDAQEHDYVRYLECGIEVHEYASHFNHLKMAVFDEDDKDFELVVLVDDEARARWILEHVRDVDRRHARRKGDSDLHGTIAALRRRIRDPRTLAMLSRHVL